MTQNPRISVVMSVWNGERYLHEAINSVLQQTFADYEFIIVNDASTDSSQQIICSFHDDRIKVINNEENIGLTMSLNKAMKMAGGEYIARQDADDISLADRFAEQLKYLDEHPDVALLGTSAYYIDENGETTGKCVIAGSLSIGRLLKGNRFIHGSTMFRTTVADELGGYNDLFRYGQDYELWLRIAGHYEVRNLTQLLYKLRFHQENIRSKNVEESILYGILARRLVRNSMSGVMLKEIKSKGIKKLYVYLSRREKAHFHTAMARMYMINNKLKLARKQYVKGLLAVPFDIIIIANLVLSYLGEGVIDKSHEIYQIIKSSKSIR
ncbi:glycosyltransferase family 2 protein [Chloroflexota bacterium]